MSGAQVLLFCRVAIGLVFLSSAAGKARDMPAFATAITDFKIVPQRWSNAAAWAFLGGECAVVLLVALGGAGLAIGFGLAAGLLAIFTSALALVLWRKQRVTCNCFGPTMRWISPYDLARNLLLIGSALAGFMLAPASLSALSSPAIILIGAMAAGFVLLVTNLADVVETLRRPLSAASD